MSRTSGSHRYRSFAGHCVPGEASLIIDILFPLDPVEDNMLLARLRPSVSTSGVAIDIVEPSTSLEVITDGRDARMNIRAEVAEAHERLGAGVLEGHAFLGLLVGHEHLVSGHLAVADEDRRVDLKLADRASTLGGDQAVGSGVLDRRRARRDRRSALARFRGVAGRPRSRRRSTCRRILRPRSRRGRSAPDSCGPCTQGRHSWPSRVARRGNRGRGDIPRGRP